MEESPPCNCPIANVCTRSRGPFREIRKPQHSILFAEGDPADHVYLVKKGTVSIHRSTSDGQTLGRTRALRQRGALLGVEALVSPTYRDSARAETPLLLCMATRSRVSEWVQQRHAASQTLLETILRARDDEFQAQSSPDGTATQRVAQWILECDASGESRDLPRTVMADMLGMRPETLSRALRSLAQQGLIEANRRHLRVIDVEGLRETLPQ